jgi:hypothetical protein
MRTLVIGIIGTAFGVLLMIVGRHGPEWLQFTATLFYPAPVLIRYGETFMIPGKLNVFLAAAVVVVIQVIYYLLISTTILRLIIKLKANVQRG